MMKVLFISNDSDGMYSFRKEVVEAASERAEVYLCTPPGLDMSYWEEIGCTFIPCKFERRGVNLFKEIKLIGFYRNLIKKLKPDIVFTYTIKPNIYGGIACARAGIPYVANITGLGTAVDSKRLMKTLSVFLYRIGLKKAKKVFFQNKYNEDFFEQNGIITGAEELLPGSGVNLEQYTVSAYPENAVIFAFIGRVMKEKGIEQFLEAAPQIKARHPEVRFEVYGFCEQDYKSWLEELQEKGVITYQAPVRNMKEVYQTVSCTVLPTYYPEGISNVLLESAASGRPVITTDRPGTREAVDDGVNGFFVKQQDTRDLIDKMEQFLSLSLKERERMGIAGREKVERSFDRKIVVQKYMNEINDVMKQRENGTDRN